MVMDDMGIGHCLTVCTCRLADNYALSTDPSPWLSYCFHQCSFFFSKITPIGNTSRNSRMIHEEIWGISITGIDSRRETDEGSLFVQLDRSHGLTSIRKW